MFFKIATFFLISGTLAIPILEPTCENACHPTDDAKINVHLVCHSHDDVGWLKTVDGYYYDSVQYIMDSVISALEENPDRKFIQVETYFLHQWWQLTTNSLRQQYIDLVNKGQIEIVNGGWTMNDEGNTHYQEIIDQFTIAHKWLQENLGDCAKPRTGWQIDPFGHSREHASIVKQIGFDSLFLNRIDFRDVIRRQTDRAMDLLWKASANLNDSEIFTSILYRHYSHPPGFCFDIDCDDSQINDIDGSPDNNIKEKVSAFTDYIKTQSDLFQSNNILVTMGDDFRYTDATRNYNNIDKLMKGFKKLNPKINGKEINLIYSTPTCYAKAVKDYVTRNQIQLEVKEDDFMPYASEPSSYFTGYYSTRPNTKKYMRSSNALLQAAKQLAAFSDSFSFTNFDLKNAIGILTHHDAICGTERKDVAKDYHRILAAAVEKAKKESSDALTRITGSERDLDLKFCLLSNITICPETYDSVDVLVYNPLGRSVSQHIHLPVDAQSWKVIDPEGKEVQHFMTKAMADWKFAADDLGLKLKSDILVFSAKEIPAVGFKVFHIQKVTSSSNVMSEKKALGKLGFDNNNIVIGEDGFVKQITVQGNVVNVKQEFLKYISANDSGNWIFRPDPENPEAQPFTDKPETSFFENDIAVEVYQKFSDWMQQVIRIYKNEDFIEFDWLVGPIDLSDGLGKEVISRFSTDLETNGKFYTDSNSRELIERQRNSRLTYNYTAEEPQSGNYYPVTSRVVIKDENIEFAVITDRAVGASSLKDGQIELMIHRARSIIEGTSGENLDDQEFGKGIMIRGSHYVTIGKTGSASAVQRDIAQRKTLQPWLYITRNEIPIKVKSFLTEELPKNLHLLSLEKWNDEDGSLLIRLEHWLERNDDVELSKDTIIDLTNIFTEFTITEAKETTLNGMQILQNVNDLKITLSPMQIKTFIVKVERH